MSEQLRHLLQEAAGLRPQPIQARRVLKAWDTFSHPVQFLCDNGREYVVKGQQAKRGIVNDHIIARLGIAMNAPVGKPQLVDIPAALKEMDPQLANVVAGLSHGTELIAGCSERENVAYCGESGNPERFAQLAVLYGWCHAGDPQFIYQNQSPRLVYSVDHGHFFPNGPEWTIDTLSQASLPQPDQTILANCSECKDSVAGAVAQLQTISDEQIISAVASPPDEWGLALDEQVALVKYFSQRRDAFQY